MSQTQVLIVGAGPTGLVLALWLNRMGVDVRIVDATQGPGTTSRALVVQARTLELYRQLDLATPVIEQGYPIKAFNIWTEGEHRARIELGAIGAGLTPYPFLHIFPQDRHERLLVERLEAAGVRVERECALENFEEDGDGIVAQLRDVHGSSERVEARYIAGCDGARSTVRKLIGVDFPGGTYRQVFYVADIEGESPALNGELNLDLDEADLLAVFAMGPGGHGRLVGTVRDERAERAETLQFSDVSQRAIDNLLISVHKLNWFSTYHVHHRVAEHFRRGHAFLVGDAGHIHSPAGGQGMNTGIGDAINLAWKLAAVVRGDAPDSLLDTYEQERIAFARKLVDTTDRLFSYVTAESGFADFVRTRIAPMFASAAYGIGPVREMIFRILSQTTISYHDSPLSSGMAGRVHGGDRLPWVVRGEVDNYAPPARIDWQVHVYGQVFPDLRAWCDRHGMILREFDWGPEHEAAGFAHNAGYLLRPDGYVALCDPGASAQALEDYFCDLDYGRFRLCQPRPAVV